MTLVQVGRVVYEAPMQTTRSAQDLLAQQLRALGEKIASCFPERERRVVVGVVVWTGTSLGEVIYRRLRTWCVGCRGSAKERVPGMVLFLLKEFDSQDEVVRVVQEIFPECPLTPGQMARARGIFNRTLCLLLTKKEQRRWDRAYLDYHFALRETVDFKRAAGLFDFTQCPPE